MSFEFVQRFCFQIRASRYFTGFYPTSELKVIVVWFFPELPFSIKSVSISYGTQSDIRVKSYCRLNLLRASVFNFECLDILWDSIGHPCQTLSSFDFSKSFPYFLCIIMLCYLCFTRLIIHVYLCLDEKLEAATLGLTHIQIKQHDTCEIWVNLIVNFG